MANDFSKILYIGSGKSALLYKNLKLNDHKIICVNNAWKLFENSSFDIWIHSGDFPDECFPKIKNYNQKISYDEYKIAIDLADKHLKWYDISPQHKVGYTIFFSGLYWIMMTLQPESIGTLGFDHDYNPIAVNQWLTAKEPGPQNRWNNKNSNQSISDWSNTFFKELPQSHFYGHGTPDPIRQGKNYLIEKFQLAQESADKLGIKLYNYSSNNAINTFEYKNIQ